MQGLNDAVFRRLKDAIRSVDGVKFPVGRSFAKVDAKDVALLSQYRWRKQGRYAATRLPDGSLLLMHRLLLSPPGDMLVDHIDGDGLNNCRHNLRVCTNSENMKNRKSSGGVSRFKGVWRDGDRWRATIRVNGKKICLGTHPTEERAARRYDAAARRWHGEFAKTNRDLGLFYRGAHSA
ncbi:MAG TPA: AP2 domain-containing protein [Pedomonas sp.]|uniref:HNH endonuclease n=1 Tax=Pedomonas sp. TaxID=2976421 RepID=UPI002F42A595